jgi:glutamyl-tRNA reductase
LNTHVKKYISELMEKILQLRKEQNIFFIDIAVPRDIDPRIGTLDKCFLYDLDDLKSIINDDSVQNSKSLEEASRIIKDSVDLYTYWKNTNDSKDIIKALREYVYKIVDSEISGSKGDIDVEFLSRRISNKILHVPINNIKAESNLQESLYLKILSDVFDLNKNEIKQNIFELNNEKRYKNRD